MQKVIDIETNGLLSDLLDYQSFPYKLKETARLWVVSIYDCQTNTVVSATNETITKSWLKEELKDVTELIAHNGIKFDFLFLKLFGLLDYRIGYLGEKDTVFDRECLLTDTLLLSRLFNPDRPTGHSLSAWGTLLGFPKTDYRNLLEELGVLDKKQPKGAEFSFFNDSLVPYCERDSEVTSQLYAHLLKEKASGDWEKAIAVEKKLADLANNREHLGFWFNKELAVSYVKDLEEKLKTLSSRINPLLPERQLNKTELRFYTLPKTQFLDSKVVKTPKNAITSKGVVSASMKKFIEEYGGEVIGDTGNYFYLLKGVKYPLLEPLAIQTPKAMPSQNLLNYCKKTGFALTEDPDGWSLTFEGKKYELPYNQPLKTVTQATIENTDYVKQYLLSLGWQPTEWSERSLVLDTQKKLIPLEKQVTSLKRWLQETLEGKYKKERLALLKLDRQPENKIFTVLYEKLLAKELTKIPTAPSVRIGVEKKICPNLIKLGEVVKIAEDFSLYLTYRHRKNAIAGGLTEENKIPETGYLSQYRESDGRIPTPAIEIGASTCRYRHVKVANVPRVSSLYGREMRSLFGSGKDAYQFGFDFSSLEARIMGHYIFPFGGEDLAQSFLKEKPEDWHTKNSLVLGIGRGDAKSFGYACIYGATPTRLAKLLNCSYDRAQELFHLFWESVSPLKQLKFALEEEWRQTGEKSITGIDGRRIVTRSKHSILNSLFQSCGAIAAKYTTVIAFSLFEKLGFTVSPFVGKPDVCSMIEYHDEVQLQIDAKFCKVKTFATEEEAVTFQQTFAKGKLGDIAPLGDGRFYITLPSKISEVIEEAIALTGAMLGLNVPLGFNYTINRNWADCH
jgi:DNA polymerase I-like protein with 3'-5' exonuclease and polymerase domains